MGNPSNSSGIFDVYVNMSIQVRTMKDKYGANEDINLTDPPGLVVIEQVMATRDEKTFFDLIINPYKN